MKKTARHQVPNPATPRRLRAVELITDRAKRYRANRNPPEGPRRCGFCAAKNPRDIDHIDGDEGNGAAHNLQYLCRSCNTLKGLAQRNAGAGRRTAQYNPERAPTFRRYVDAVLVLRGDNPGNVAKAARVLQATPPESRREYIERIGAARNPQPGTPTYAQYAHAVSIHQRGAHDEGGKVIHATPPGTRSSYARRIAATKKQRRESIPF
jgi:hypothetical protein